MLGFSVYLGTKLIEKDYQYLQVMKKSGFSEIFTSLHIPEEDSQEILQQLSKLSSWCKELNLRLIADVSANSLRKMHININRTKDIERLGLDGLRIDDGIEMKTIAKLSENFPIALNASTISINNLSDLKNEHANFRNIEAWHNYYPRPDTGLSASWLKEKNTWLQAQGLKTMAFVAGDLTRRGPLYDGLPTLEKHRYMNPFLSMLQLKELNCDHIFIGDPSIKPYTQMIFNNYVNSGAITLRLEKPISNLSAHDWHNRPDVAENVIRLVEGRQRQLFDTQPQSTPIFRQKGYITVDNIKYDRYAGELQIIKKKLRPDQKVNIIGKIIDEDIPLLDYIGSNQKILFGNN